jgi:hypothetical protein
MKKRNFILVLIAILGLLFTGCSKKDTDTTYSIWTETISYSEYYDLFGALSDGYYVRVEFTDAEFNQMKPSLPNEYKYMWTEDQIANWFIGRGFSNSKANQEKAWLMTIKHGFIAGRSGNTVDLLLK